MLMSRTNFSIQTNSVDPDQTAPSLIRVHTVCYRDIFNGPADDKEDYILSPLAAEELMVFLVLKVSILFMASLCHIYPNIQIFHPIKQILKFNLVMCV